MVFGLDPMTSTRPQRATAHKAYHPIDRTYHWHHPAPDHIPQDRQEEQPNHSRSQPADALGQNLRRLGPRSSSSSPSFSGSIFRTPDADVRQSHAWCDRGDSPEIRDQEKQLLPAFFDAIHNSMTTANVRAMNAQAWEVLTKTFDGIETLEGENMYLWTRDLITMATTRALFGETDPFQREPGMVRYVWDWESQLADLVARPLPRLTVRKAYLPRLKLQAFMKQWYAEEQYLTDPTVSGLARERAVTLRTFGFTNDEIGQLDSILPSVGVTNSAPQAYWLICYIFGRPDLVTSLRDELVPLISREEGLVTIHITQIENRCPLLVSCYKEALRLRNHNVSPRVMVADTTISSLSGRHYLLKKGVDVQIVSGIAHRMEDIWGSDAADFDPTRFLPPQASDKDAKRTEKLRDRAFIPFGGGRHLCPGRAFAFTEIMSLVATLLVGFEVEARGVGFGESVGEAG